MEQQPATKPSILLLGCGHWANPNADAVNVEYDDMLAPARQREIEACLDRLARFQPTKVAVEVMSSYAGPLHEQYRQYRAGTFALTANEVYQLGFRLAARFDHDQIHPVDWHNMQRPIAWDEAITFAREHSQVEFLGGGLGGTDAAKESEADIRNTTIRDMLLELNEPAGFLADNHNAYMDLAHIGEDDDYIGADAILRWYERNMKIFVNITRLSTSPRDRVLVVIGARHVPLLTHFVQGSDRYTLEAVSAYLG